MRNLMIDIETLSSEPGACILSIGACTFSGGRKAPSNLFSIALNYRESTGKISTSTAAWWEEQHQIPKEYSFSGALSESDACAAFSTYCAEVRAHTIWAGPVTFDVPILRDMYRRCGLKFPFHYRAERDARTVVQLAKGYGMSREGTLERTEEIIGGTFYKHHPMHDAVFQAVVVQKAMNYLGDR